MLKETKFMAEYLSTLSYVPEDDYDKFQEFSRCLSAMPETIRTAYAPDIKYRKFCKLIQIKKTYGTLEGIFDE